MSFLQPWLLLALPLISLPIIIHLINQWRYQTKRWGAMQFLLAANRMNRGYAKLRQYLILAMRVLALTGLIFAISRPLASVCSDLVLARRRILRSSSSTGPPVCKNKVWEANQNSTPAADNSPKHCRLSARPNGF